MAGEDGPWLQYGLNMIVVQLLPGNGGGGGRPPKPGGGGGAGGGGGGGSAFNGSSNAVFIPSFFGLFCNRLQKLTR